ncbi:MAG: GPP34 family phosphoprotein [Dokdonella sp.]|uniref:GPP34 family phosphoprotein n=1 Tax=Dokdonella sp. TaxID=2291710 RepID=UPI002CE78763|nr:GPP34 family phosphoprotein [Dokdonella sp.]HOX70856.1 GPP34 family phosphoprotein [Dokdonella sp.]HPG94569.1 GPP34 family phosphoprotein [Dokdonella sp.]HPN79088.1 GPP34 family phosphoprotein [Dokdonella sp.]
MSYHGARPTVVAWQPESARHPSEEPSVLIAEQLMLLCINPERGDFETTRSHADINTLAAAALILDLAEQRRLRFKRGHVAIEAMLPTTHPQVAAAAQVLAGPVNGLPLNAAIELLVARLNPISLHLLESLFRRDVLHRVRASWLPWSALRFPLRSWQARNEAIAQLNRDSTHGITVLRGLGLLVLTDMAGQLSTSLAGEFHEVAAQRLLHLAREQSEHSPDHEMLIEMRRCLLG